MSNRGQQHPQQWGQQMAPQQCSQTVAANDDDDEIILPQPAPQQQPEPEVTTGGCLSLNTKIEYKALPRDRSQDVFGIVTVQASTAKVDRGAEERQPMDIICVLDQSGSMQGEKIRLVQEAVRFLIRECQSRDRLSIVTFNNVGQRVLRLRRMDHGGKDDATTAVLRLSANGGTNISSGMTVALDIAESRRHRNPVSAILLLTDGRDTHGSMAALPALVSRAQRANCALYTFGFGVDHDAQLLSNIAEQAQTPFTFVEDIDQIDAAFAGAIGGLSSVSAQRVEVVLNCKVQLKNVHTPFTTTRDGDNTVVQIPDMFAGERRDILVELNVPESHNDETVLLETSARYWSLAEGAAMQTATVSMRADRIADEAQPDEEPDAEVVTQKNRVAVAQTLQTAARYGDEGRFAEAQTALTTQQNLLKSKKHKSANSEELVLELEDACNRMKSRSSWELGGRAEVCDAMNMHKQQRATNMNISSGCSNAKGSKMMYCTSKQQSWISKVSKSG